MGRPLLMDGDVWVRLSALRRMAMGQGARMVWIREVVIDNHEWLFFHLDWWRGYRDPDGPYRLRSLDMPRRCHELEVEFSVMVVNYHGAMMDIEGRLPDEYGQVVSERYYAKMRDLIKSYEEECWKIIEGL